MVRFIKLVIDNWHLIAIGLVLIFWLSMTGSITEALKNAKKGIKSTLNPLGFIVFIALGIIGYIFYTRIKAM